MRKKIFIFSDIHIADKSQIDNFTCEEEVKDFLKYVVNQKEENNLDEVELIILGDLFDFWKVKGKEKLQKIIKNYKELCEAFKKAGEEIKIILIPGNHDHELMYEESYRDILLEYNLEVKPQQFLKIEIKNGNRVFKIIAEHGNQVEPANKFIEFGKPPNSSLAYHLGEIIIYPFMALGAKENQLKWLSRADLLDSPLIPWWVMSKYFYYELGPILQAVLTPLLILFSFAVPYVIFDVSTNFYNPKFIQAITHLIDSNIVTRTISFILYLDLVIVFLLVITWFIKKGVYKKLKKCGIQSFTEVLVSLKNQYRNRAIKLLNGLNEYKEEFDLYICGHTHIHNFEEIEKDKYYIDLGCFRQAYKRIPTRFKLPSVFVEYHGLSFLEIDVDNDSDELSLKLRNWPKPIKPHLNFLEHIAVHRRKIPKPIYKLKTIKKLIVPL